VDVEIVRKPAFTVVGLPYEGRNEHGEIAALWEEFRRRSSEVARVVDGAFGVCEGPGPDGRVRYLAGLAVSEVGTLPKGMSAWTVPAQTYAVFPSTLPRIHETYRAIFESWLPAAGRRPAAGPDFELYDERFDLSDPESRFRIFVPLA